MNQNKNLELENQQLKKQIAELSKFKHERKGGSKKKTLDQISTPAHISEFMQDLVVQDTKYKQERPEWLKKAHLEAVLTLPPDLFAGQETGAHTCLMVWKNGVQLDKPTYLMNGKNDGFIVLKGKRFDKNGNWETVRKGWLSMYLTKYSQQPTIAISKKLTASDCWLADAHVETDYSPIFTDPTFLKKRIEKVIRDYLAFRISTFSDIDWTKEENERK